MCNNSRVHRSCIVQFIAGGRNQSVQRLLGKSSKLSKVQEKAQIIFLSSDPIQDKTESLGQCRRSQANFHQALQRS